MEMKTKKNKMFLAMVVVAALAMVSVAGMVVVSDNSDAVKNPIGLSDAPIIIDANDSALDMNFYVNEWNVLGMGIGIGIAHVYVLPDVTVSGTINLGYYADPVNYTGWTVTDSIKVTNASGFRVTVVAISVDGEIVPGLVLDDQISFIAVGDASSTTNLTGSFELTKGEAVLGQLSPGVIQAILDEYVTGPATGDILANLLGLVTPFTGTLKAGTLELKAEDVAGIMVSVEGSVPTMTGASMGMSATPLGAKLSISGTAVIDYPTEIKSLLTLIPGSVVNSVLTPILSPFIGGSAVLAVPQVYVGDVSTVIEAGADISVGNVEPLAASEFTVESGDAIVYAYLVSPSGRIFAAMTPTPNSAVFYDVPAGQYTFFITTFDGTDVGAFFSNNFTVSGAMGTYNVSLGNNKIATGNGAMAVTDLTFTADGFEYPLTTTAMFAFNATTGEIGDISTAGEVTFPSGYTAGDEINFIAGNRSIPGTPVQAFIGDDTPANYFNKVLTVGSALGAGQIFANSSNVLSQDSIGYYALFMDLTVKGTLKFLYTNDNIRGIMLNLTGVITPEDDGVIEYGVSPAVSPIVPDMGKINAAYYFKNVPATGAPTQSTYYFTTIKKALEDSDGADIVIVGTIVIKEDENWEVDQNTKIILGDSSQPGRIEVGVYDPTDDTKTKSPALNIDEQIEIIIANGSYEVISGQIIFNTNTFPIFPPDAHVRIVRTAENKIIYADVATGFNVVRTGETLELITDAELRYDATLIAGATFDDKGYTMRIPAGKTLTVNGIYKSTSPGKLVTERDLINGGVGTLVINNGTATFPVGTTVENNGSIKVNTAGTFTLDGTMNGFNTGVLIIDGTFNANGAVTAIAELELRGTLKIGSAGFQVVNLITVGTEPTLLSALQNNAVLTGSISIGPAAVVLVYGNSTVTKANFTYPTGIGETKFVYQNLSTVYATQYGALPGVPGTLKYLTCDNLRDFTLVGWYESAGMTPATEVTPSRFATSEFPGSIAVLYGNFVHKTFTVTLSDSNEGINWVVNGVGQGPSKVITVNYGAKVKVNVHVLNGFSGTPVILRDGGAYTANNEITVTDNTVFTVSGVKVADPPKDDGGLTLIEILLIIIVIIIAIISIIVALRLLRS